MQIIKTCTTEKIKLYILIAEIFTITTVITVPCIPKYEINDSLSQSFESPEAGLKAHAQRVMEEQYRSSLFKDVNKTKKINLSSICNCALSAQGSPEKLSEPKGVLKRRSADD